MFYANAKDISNKLIDIIQTRQFPEYLFSRYDSFKNTEDLSMTKRRAYALNAVLENMDLEIIQGELLLGIDCLRNSVFGDDSNIADVNQYLSKIGARHFGSNNDHHAINYKNLLDNGIGGIINLSDSVTDRNDFLDSVGIALRGLSDYIVRWSDYARASDKESPYSDLLNIQADMLANISINPPKTFWEALQLITIVELPVMWADLRAAQALGRMDQYLYPFYKKDIEDNIITKEFAQDLMDHFFAKIANNMDVRNIAIGGINADGEDSVNDLTYIILESCKRIGKAGGNITARISKKNPDEYILKCIDVIKTGIGYPAVFNDDLEIKALMNFGYPFEHAVDYCFVGCIEVFISGKQAPWSDSRFNMLKCVNLALRNGFDSISGIQVGPKTGQPDTWEGFYDAFLIQIAQEFKKHITEIAAVKAEYDNNPEFYTSPLLSALTDDCIKRGKDICNGGAVYPSCHGVAAMGIGSVSDSLMCIKKYIYDEKLLTIDDLVKILDVNFECYEKERHMFINNSPKYGNNISDVDDIAKRVTHDVSEIASQCKINNIDHIWILLGANISNIYAGEEVGATPDGRLSKEPLSDAGSPYFGVERNGPTAVALSVASPEYINCPAGNVVNMRFDPETFKTEKGCKSLLYLIRACFEKGGIQLQFNTNSNETLLDAMEHPENYRDLVVRVSGFSANFVTLPKEVQEDILKRTKHSF